MSHHALFAYGTLQAGELVLALLGRSVPGQKACLPGYACYALRAYVYPGLRPQPGAITAGVLYLGLDSRDLALLDAYEDDFYERRSLTVQTLEGSRLAEVYVVREEYFDLLDSQPWDFEHFRATVLNEFLLLHRTAQTEP